MTQVSDWELIPVWPAAAGERFLKSVRDESAAQVWQRDVYAGAA